MAKKSLKGRELEAADKNWLVSYADMMTGLVLLFALMFVMTTARAQNMVEASKAETAAAQTQVTELKAEAQKQAAEQAAEEAKGAQTAAKGGTGSATTARAAIPTAGNTAKPKTTSSPATIHPTQQGMQTYVNQHGDLSSVGVKQDSEGIKFVIRASILFDPGSSQLRTDSYRILNELGAYLKTLNSDIVISGHTDNVPVNNKNYQSNWELSCDRAVKVLRYLTDSCAVNPKRFMAIGYGEYRPVADNGTAEGREQNDRVEILVAQK